jgi:hypothetical protein
MVSGGGATNGLLSESESESFDIFVYMIVW